MDRRTESETAFSSGCTVWRRYTSGNSYNGSVGFLYIVGMNKELRFGVGECRNDIGGYFIIDEEKTVVPQEKFADNMLYIKHVDGDDYLYSAEIRSI
jgi:hypothetical protein